MYCVMKMGVVAYAYKYLEGIARLGPFAGDIMHYKMGELHLNDTNLNCE